MKELLGGEPTYGINFDRVQWDAESKCYVIVELLLCEEAQSGHGITPFTSHPNRYFHKNAQKFISLWELAGALKAILYLVNYAKKGTRHADEVLLMKVVSVDASAAPPVVTKDKKFTRAGFAEWFRALNRRGAR